jgi:hypothetical protein
MTTDLASISVNSAAGDLDRHDALHAPFLDHQIDAEMFVEALDRRVLDRGLEQRVQHVKAGLVGGKPGALDLHAAEGAHVDMPVGVRLHGQPQCSSWVNSSCAWPTK